jgi:hypothetical protein
MSVFVGSYATPPIKPKMESGVYRKLFELCRKSSTPEIAKSAVLALTPKQTIYGFFVPKEQETR